MYTVRLGELRKAKVKFEWRYKLRLRFRMLTVVSDRIQQRRSYCRKTHNRTSVIAFDHVLRWEEIFAMMTKTEFLQFRSSCISAEPVKFLFDFLLYEVFPCFLLDDEILLLDFFIDIVKGNKLQAFQ